MIIGSKSNLIEEQLKDRKSKGIKFIEIHSTLDDFKDLKITLEKKHLLRQYGLSVYAVHSPILNSYQEECVLGETNTLLRKDNMNLIKKSIILADKLSDLSNPVVIVSAGGLVAEGEFVPDFSREKKEYFQKDLWELKNYISENYPRVMILVKNNPTVKKDESGLFHYGYGYEDDLIHWIRDIKDAHIGVCLDIANALGTIRYNEKTNRSSDFTSIEYFLYYYKPYLKLIHLSNGRDLVASRGESGLPFLSSNSEDLNIIKRVLAVIHDIKYTLPITIEVNEEDDSNAINFVKTRDTIIQSFKK
jgi:sugar phosphate isomerase/epimerase